MAVRVLAAPDKFRGTAAASQIAAAVADAARAAGAACDMAPMADGGEGTLEALGGPNRTSRVTGPLGRPVDAAWRLSRRTAVIEMAQASGLVPAGGAEGNDVLAATTTGTGELIAEAVRCGANRIIVGVGGSATTDGGLGALDAIGSPARLRGVELVVACDVRTAFCDAAEVFGPQKGASEAQVEMLTRRLNRLAQVYLDDHGVDVNAFAGAGAAGGLAGGLAAFGAELVDGFELVAAAVGLDERISRADLVVTGEGRYDATSREGKVVGGVSAMAQSEGVAVLAVVGGADAETPPPPGAQLVDLVARFGADRALRDPCECVQVVVGEALAALSGSSAR